MLPKSHSQIGMNYYACVSFVDAQVGKIVGELNRLDLLKDTIIILWGDHGWKLGEYSTWSKHTNFELDTHAPMILTDPDSPKDIRVKALTEFVDIYPTLADLCGLPLPEGLEGTSMVPLLGNPDLPWKQAAFSQYPRGKKIMGYSIRTEKYRYTEWQNRKTGEVQDRELYDLKNDPLCKESIVFKSENKELVDKLQVMLKAGWQKAKPE
jgi:iduronate 2-sulfatase